MICQKVNWGLEIFGHSLLICKKWSNYVTHCHIIVNFHVHCGPIKQRECLYLSLMLSCYSHLYSLTVFVPACVLVLAVGLFLFCILYVTNLALWPQEFNKLTYLLTYIQSLRLILTEFLYRRNRATTVKLPPSHLKHVRTLLADKKCQSIITFISDENVSGELIASGLQHHADLDVVRFRQHHMPPSTLSTTDRLAGHARHAVFDYR